MTTFLVAHSALALAALTLAAWVAFAIGALFDHYRIPRLEDVAPPGPDDSPLPRLSIIVTAHNEERSIEGALRSLLALRYHDYEIVFVNDRSTDCTGEIAERLGARDPRLNVLHIDELPAGWFGKPHAAQRGADAATGDVLLFTDADVVFAPDAAALGVRYLVRQRLDHLAAAPRLTLTGVMLQACTITFHLLVGARQRLWKVQDPRSSAFIGVGSYTIMRADSYRAVGGHARVALRPDEDIRLGQAVKMRGMRSAFLKGKAMLECTWYHSLGDFVRGLEKNLFAALDYSLFLATGATATLIWLAAAPLVLAPLLLANGQPLAGLLFAACPLIYWVVATTASRDDSYPWWSALPFPLAVLIFVYVLWRSTFLTIFRGVIWGGPPIPFSKLRKARIRVRG
ncbi:MAG: glycosyltransferase [Bacteroidetes bacterium SB0662_bin_6]|nr:glycosyltransferase [Bacteroidetes bacterium SB0668_bin_1]MYE05057.1 glycosyltransferase [Bacteroidetes bacterium SB0662_bin_6]